MYTDSLIHKRGRPNKAKELEIETKLWPYFSKSLGPETVSKITGYNIKTVRRYYNKFLTAIITQKEKDYVKEWQVTKRIGQLALEQELNELHELQSSLKKEFETYEKSGEPVPSWMYKERRRLSESIRDTILSMVNFGLTPTADFTLDNQTREVLQENGMA